MNNTVTTVIIGYQALTIRHLYISHNAPFLCSTKPLHKQCLQFLLRQLQYPGEKAKPKVMQNFGLQTRCIMEDVQWKLSRN